VYLATVIDLATREVIGYAMADHHRAELVTDALTMAAGHGGLQHDFTPRSVSIRCPRSGGELQAISGRLPGVSGDGGGLPVPSPRPQYRLTGRLPRLVSRQKVVIAAPSGAVPVVTVPMTRLVAVSITDTVVEPLLVT
jgi:hypothetical protein